MKELIIASSSVGGGGAVTGAVAGILIGLLLLRRRRGGGSRRTTVVLSVCAAVAVVGLVGSLIGSGGKEPDTFASAHGKQARDGFLKGCTEGIGKASACRCIFQRMTSTPPFDKPSGFEKLIPAIKGAKTAGDLPANLRDVLTRALIDCRAV